MRRFQTRDPDRDLLVIVLTGSDEQIVTGKPTVLNCNALIENPFQTKNTGKNVSFVCARKSQT